MGMWGTNQMAPVSCWRDLDAKLRGLSAEPGNPETWNRAETHTFYTTDLKAGSEATHDPWLPSRTCMVGPASKS